MKNIFRKIALVLLVLTVASCFVACFGSPDETTDAPFEAVDYVSELKLDMNSSTLKQEVTIHLLVDGDTTHFNVPTSVFETGILKARYIAINTPESTGKIEEWGKAASNFTKEKLSKATSIIIESDDDKWNADSTGNRYLVWVWYKTAENEEYRNLNLEILQNGYCIASSTSNNRYGEICMKALNQAKAQKLHVYSDEKDELFYYGDAIELSLLELRTNIEEYTDIKVAFEGVITLNDSDSVYVEEYDPSTDMYYGITVYYGNSGLTGDGLKILSIGNRVRIVGTVQYWSGGDTYQISGLQYRQMKPDDPSNIQKISDGHSPAFVETDLDTFLNGKVEVELESGKKTFDYAYLAMSTSISMDNLRVTDVYTTVSTTDSNGAISITCTDGTSTIVVRTAVLYDENGNRVTEDVFVGKTIDVRGIVDYYDGKYQIRVLSYKDIDIKN